MEKGTINKLLNISESFQMPRTLLQKLLEDSEAVCNDFYTASEEDLSHDWFTQYFEEDHANKSKMAQDFTPVGLCDLVADIVGKADKIADVCAGSGGLTIAMWQKNPEAEFICFEYSERVIPLLLLNLALRNMKAVVCRMDILTGDEFEYYRICPGKKFGQVSKIEHMPETVEVGAVISNPPYSMKYKPEGDRRFPQYQWMLPSNFADYVFVAFAMQILRYGGTAGFILPHGVLFRSNKEGMFRKMLCETKTMNSVIGLPDKLFINTGIPVCVLVLKKNSNSDGVLFIDAKKQCKREGKQNVIRQQDHEKILSAYRIRANIDKFSYVAELRELAKNDYNLNIPRYVDTSEPEELPDPVETFKKIAELNKEIYEAEKNILETMKQLKAFDSREQESLNGMLQALEKITEDDHGQLCFSLPSG